ncbi:hypothetical protein GWI33_020047 [Rhynchophorus ferrugineus]|uniref:Uncharacterized protein n=1 Tax=Rhynchophorus ferrugineus TaxID=354439 RepID=A0A834HS49_RHYFE|nr:hypothetical protein GWI33_020047 [Rhynchophorus ferrugineus]
MPKDRKYPPKCANSGKPHTTNFSDCKGRPIPPINKLRRPIFPPTHVWVRVTTVAWLLLLQRPNLNHFLQDNFWRIYKKIKETISSTSSAFCS